MKMTPVSILSWDIENSHVYWKQHSSDLSDKERKDGFTFSSNKFLL